MKSLLIIFITLVSLVSIQAQTANVITENANLRGTPSQSGTVVTTLELNSTVEVIKQSGTWFLVQSTEYSGWMHGNTIRYESASTSLYSTPTATKKIKSSPKKSSSSQYYIRGPRGGCYYINGNGNKTYVSRSLCN